MSQNNCFQGIKIEFHILQSFPVSCLNRDDLGSPKSARIGGVNRARVSSQAWKRPVRLALPEFGVTIGVRSKHMASLIQKECVKLGASEEQAKACGDSIASFFSKDTLIFFSGREARYFAKYAKGCDFDAAQLKDKEVHKLSKKKLNPAMDGLDIALFGRMVANAPKLQVEASCGFAHAISTHRVDSDIDFFTAVDDLSNTEDTAGAGHLGSLEFNSATYYRYVSLDLGQLTQNLGGYSQDTIAAVAPFIKALFVGMPSARQNSMSASNFWDYGRILLRKGQRLQACFEQPVKAKEGYLQPSIERLDTFLSDKATMAGTLFGKIAEFSIPDVNIDALIAGIESELRQIADESGGGYE